MRDDGKFVTIPGMNPPLVEEPERVNYSDVRAC